MRPRHLATLLALALVARASAARADDDLDALLETKVVSSASSQAESSSDAPATTTTITADELRRHGIRTLDEALNFLSLGVVSTNPLHSVEVGARGVLLTADYGNHMLLLVNGHMHNEQWAGTAYFERGAGVPIELIDRIEVILGPGSVLYGSNAMLGVISVITKKASEYRGLHLIGEAELLTSGRLGLGFGRAGTLGGVPVEVTGQIEYFRQQGPSFTFGPQRYGNDSVTGQPKRFTLDGPATGVWGGVADKGYSSEVPSALVRVVAGPFELTTRALSYRRVTPYLNSFNQGVGLFNDPGSGEIDRVISVDLRYRRVLNPTADLSLRLYGDASQYQQKLLLLAPEDCLSQSPGGCRTSLAGGARWVGFDPQLRFDWKRDGRYTSLLGVDTRMRNYYSDVTASDPDTGRSLPPAISYDQTELVAGAYLQQTARPWSPLTLNVGARLDIDPRFGTALSPRGMAAVSPWHGATVKAIYSEAFRAPSGYELLYTDKVSQLQAEGLKAERERSIEASFEQRFGAHRLFFSVFRSWWRDLISLGQADEGAVARGIQSGALPAGATGVFQYRNVGQIDNLGWGAAYEGALLSGRLRFGANLTGAYADRHEEGVDQPLTVTPRLFGNARVSYELGGALPVVALVAQQTGPAYADRAFDGGFTPLPRAPAQTTLRGTLSGPFPAVKNLSYRLTASWSRSDRSAYVAGPIQAATPEQPSAELAPVDTFRTAVALYYSFDP